MRMRKSTIPAIFVALCLSLSVSCGGGGGGHCSEKQIDSLRRFDCVPASKGAQCDINNQPVPELTAQQYDFLACCQTCGYPGKPGCDECAQSAN
jgi:hypothetical protein